MIALVEFMTALVDSCIFIDMDQEYMLFANAGSAVRGWGKLFLAFEYGITTLQRAFSASVKLSIMVPLLWKARGLLVARVEGSHRAKSLLRRALGSRVRMKLIQQL
jgi:hypothetical protein